ncbi:MAG: hypothetical protein KJZ78_24180, partial [Bryobacteraceae bacterium]|nr:hypothetical protein [Bryobacteraceae bacterium]
VLDLANERLGNRHAAIGPSHFLKTDLDDEWVRLIWKHAGLPYVAQRFFGEEERLKDFGLEVLRQALTQPSVAGGGTLGRPASRREADAAADGLPHVPRRPDHGWSGSEAVTGLGCGTEVGDFVQEGGYARKDGTEVLRVAEATYHAEAAPQVPDAEAAWPRRSSRRNRERLPKGRKQLCSGSTSPKTG